MTIRWGAILTPETITKLEAALERDLSKLGPIDADDTADDVPAEDGDKEGE